MPWDLIAGPSREFDINRDPKPEQPRPLTHDEKKAAEAAFRGDPFNPAWSAAAAKIYAGIVSAMERKQATTDSDIDTECMAFR